MENNFTIKNLSCGYSPEKTVLEIPELNIPRGKLIFVIGVSGGGKSTLLETLGLMNKTIQNGSDLHFHEADGKKIPMAQLWSATHGELDEFRRKHFSFIFQKTNLMPNFSCGENMMLPAIFKGQAYQKVKAKVFEYMKDLDLRSQIFDDKIANISGGQRQRLAFIRAMVADFSVLFGDEPTGNLDPGTAESMMGVLKNYLKNQHKTGIVVSHDIRLAADFADMIIPIEMKGQKENRIGTIQKSKLLYRVDESKWKDEKNTYERIEKHLKQLIA